MPNNHKVAQPTCQYAKKYINRLSFLLFSHTTFRLAKKDFFPPQKRIVQSCQLLMDSEWCGVILMPIKSFDSFCCFCFDAPGVPTDFEGLR